MTPVAFVAHRVKTRLTKVDRERFLDLVRQGQNRQTAAAKLGYTGTTFRQLCKTDSDFNAAYEEAVEHGREFRANFVDWLADGLLLLDDDGSTRINPEAPPQVILRYFERWNPNWKTGTGATTVNVNSETEVTHVHVEGFADQLRERLQNVIEAQVVRVDDKRVAQIPAADPGGGNGATNGHRNGSHPTR